MNNRAWIIVALLWSRLAQGGSLEWTNQGPWGGQANTLLTSPSQELWLLSTGLIFRRDEPKGQWVYVPLDSSFDAAQGIAFDPIDPNRLYVATRLGRILRSTDKGKTFQQSALIPGIPANAVTVNPFDPKILLASVSNLGFGGVFRSVDRGVTWARTELSGRQIGIVQFAPDVRDQVYAATSGQEGGQLYFSKDGGLTFELIGTIGGPGDPFALDIGLPGVRKNTMYASVIGAGGVNKSADGGKRWFSTNVGRSTVGVARYLDSVIAATSGGLYETKDGGDSWTLLDQQGSLLYRRSIKSLTARSDGYLYAGTQQFGVLRSKAPGQAYEDYSRGFSGTQTLVLDVEPTRGDLLLGTATGEGLYFRNGLDRFRRWTPLGRNLDLAQPQCIALLDRKNSSRIYTTYLSEGTSGVKASDDGGKTWLDLSLNIGGVYPVSLAVPPDHEGPNGLIVGAIEGVFRYRQDLSAWVQIFPGNLGLPRVLKIDPEDPNRLYVGTSFGIYRTDDGGRTYFDLSTPVRSYFGDDPNAPVDLETLDIEIDPNNHQKVYATFLERGSWISTKIGKNLEPYVIIDSPDTITSIAIRPGFPAEQYFGTRYNGVFRTKDGGRTFEVFDKNLDYYFVNDLVFDRRTPQTLYARHFARGVASYSFGQVGDGEIDVPVLAWNGAPLIVLALALWTMARKKFLTSPEG